MPFARKRCLTVRFLIIFPPTSDGISDSQVTSDLGNAPGSRGDKAKRLQPKLFGKLLRYLLLFALFLEKIFKGAFYQFAGGCSFDGGSEPGYLVC